MPVEGYKFVTVHTRHSQNRHFVALRCYAAHFCSLIGAPFVHSCRQIFMRDRKKPTRMYE